MRANEVSRQLSLCKGSHYGKFSVKIQSRIWQNINFWISIKANVTKLNYAETKLLQASESELGLQVCNFLDTTAARNLRKKLSVFDWNPLFVRHFLFKPDLNLICILLQVGWWCPHAKCEPALFSGQRSWTRIRVWWDLRSGKGLNSRDYKYLGDFHWSRLKEDFKKPPMVDQEKLIRRARVPPQSDANIC